VLLRKCNRVIIKLDCLYLEVKKELLLDAGSCGVLISLIGMSGSGKSYWSERLSRLGFRRFCLDALITRRLSSRLAREDGTSLTLGEWMGFPFQEGYEEREELYLACEKQLMTEILDWIDENGSEPDRNVVVDTTGSVIYTGDDILNRLSALTTIIYFAVPAVIREAMLRQYQIDPRPVLWRGFFSVEPGEIVERALFRSYHALLDSREALYRQFADVEIDYFTRNNPGFKVADLLEIVKRQK
jgi:hypothetical protein